MNDANRVKEIFAEAVQLPETERAAFVAKATGDDEVLRFEVEALLSAMNDADFASFFAAPTGQRTGVTMQSNMSEGPGTVIDRYKLLQQIGEGGFGVVYMAEQREPVTRKVALKIIKLGMDTKQVIARFEAERQALAMMDHPNIAKVFDAGATDTGRPYFVMELVRGEPITQYCDKNNLSVQERLALFQQVCHAVQHAHHKGIIHRDIKPNNVLITLHDGKPVPKVIDFGIAKATSARLTEKTVFTEFRQFIGTPEYMSPEQAEMSGLDVDTRSDVYSLGVLLYELLTGTTPFDSNTLRRAGYGEIQRIIREETPHKPSTRVSTLDMLPSVAAHRHIEPKKLSMLMRGDLDWIVMKAMEKDRTRRYETANGFAMDIQHYLHDEPVSASPPSASYKLKKLIRRNRGAFAAGAAVFIVLLLGAVGTTYGMVWALNERERVTHQAGRASDALRQVTDEFAAKITDPSQEPVIVPIIGSAEGAEVEALARTAVNLVHSIDAARQDTQREAATASAVSDFLVTLFEANDPNESLGADTTAREMLDRGAARIRTELTDQPEVQTRLMDVMGNVYQNLGLFDEAEQLLKEALERRRTLHGPDSLEFAETKRKLAWNLMRTGHAEEAETMYRDVLRIVKTHSPEDSPQVADALNGLAGPITDLGRFDEARDLLEQVLRIRRNDPHTDDKKLAGSLHNLGLVLRVLGQYDEAIAMLKEAVATMRRVYGDNHPKYATGLNALGLTMRDAGKSAEALPLLREAMKIGEKVWGPDNPNVGSFANNLALVLQDLGDLDEAEQMYRKVLAIDRATLPPDHPYLATSLDNLAVLLHERERFSEAKPLYEEAYQIRKNKFGDENQETVISVNNLAVLAKDEGDLARAETMFRESLRIRAKLYEAPHGQIAVGMTNLADVLAAENKYEEAEKLYRHGLAMRIDALGPDHPAIAANKVLLGELLADLGRTNEAETLFREALELRRRVLPKGHHLIALTLSDLARIEAGRGNFAVAEAMLLEAQQILTDALGPNDEQTTRSIRALVDLYDAWNEAEPDVGHDADASTWRVKLDAKNATPDERGQGETP